RRAVQVEEGAALVSGVQGAGPSGGNVSAGAARRQRRGGRTAAEKRVSPVGAAGALNKGARQLTPPLKGNNSSDSGGGGPKDKGGGGGGSDGGGRTERPQSLAGVRWR